MDNNARKVDFKRIIGRIKYLAKGSWLHSVVDSWRDKATCGISLDKTDEDWAGYKEGKGYAKSQPTRYCVLKKAFKGLDIKPTDKFLDMGCGKGRVLAFIIRNKIMPLENVTGIDINPEVLEINRSWTKKYPELTVEYANGLEYDYSPYDIIFIFQPIYNEFFIKLIEQFEKTAVKKFTLIYVADDYSGQMLQGRKGWTMLKREKFYRIHGIPAHYHPHHFSHWSFDPSQK